MSDIRITPTAQLAALLALLGLIAAAMGAQVPEIRRYLKVRSM
jgi:Family of unknown function (DUF6893)